MAKNLTLLNMHDMLALITDAALQRKFIKLYAPAADVDIDWNGLESLADIPRAEMIESALNKLNSTAERKKQYDELFAQLRPVSFANADDDNFATILESIADYPELNCWYKTKSNEFKEVNAAMLAVIVNLAARGAFEDMPISVRGANLDGATVQLVSSSGASTTLTYEPDLSSEGVWAFEPTSGNFANPCVLTVTTSAGTANFGVKYYKPE